MKQVIDFPMHTS